MSCDFVVWNTASRLSDEEAAELYAALSDDDLSGLTASATIDAFYEGISTAFPNIDVDRSFGHVELSCSSRQADEVERVVWQLAHKHGLAIFDPQASSVTYPIAGGGFTRARPGTQMSATALGLLFAGALLCVGLRGVWWVVQDTWLALDSRAWIGGYAEVDRVSMRGGTAPEIEFRFSVKGIEYRGTRFTIPPTKLSPREAERLSRTYHPGATIGVLYDPTDPSRSVVLRPTLNYFFTFGFGAAALGFVGAGAYLSTRLVVKRLATETPNKPLQPTRRTAPRG